MSLKFFHGDPRVHRRRSLQRRRSGPRSLALAAALASAAALRGDGVVRDSIGPISSGRGGTNLAFSDNLMLINDNPAGVVKNDGYRFDLSVALLKLDVNYKDPQNDADNRSQFFVLPDAAFSMRVHSGAIPVNLGIGLFFPAGYGANYSQQSLAYGQQKYYSNAALAKILPSISVDLGRWVSVGASVGVGIQNTQLEAPYTFQTGALAGTPVLVKLDTSGVGLAWNVGLQVHPTERWSLGLAYIAETQIQNQGTLKVNGAGVIPFPDPDAKYHADVEMTWPRSVGLGTAYRFDRGTIALDFLWFNWSSAFDALTFKLKNGDNPFFDAVAGSSPSDKFPLEWHDSYTVRLGGELMLTESDTLRAGYIYFTNPVPDQTLTPLIPGTLQHNFSVGYGHRFGKHVGLDAAYQFSFGEREQVTTSKIIGGDFDSSSDLAMDHWLVFGLTISF